MPIEVIKSFAYIKKAIAKVNVNNGLDKDYSKVI